MAVLPCCRLFDVWTLPEGTFDLTLSLKRSVLYVHVDSRCCPDDRPRLLLFALASHCSNFISLHFSSCLQEYSWLWLSGCIAVWSSHLWRNTYNASVTTPVCVRACMCIRVYVNECVGGYMRISNVGFSLPVIWIACSHCYCRFPLKCPSVYAVYISVNFVQRAELCFYVRGLRFTNLLLLLLHCRKFG